MLTNLERQLLIKIYCDYCREHGYRADLNGLLCFLSGQGAVLDSAVVDIIEKNLKKGYK